MSVRRKKGDRTSTALASLSRIPGSRKMLPVTHATARPTRTAVHLAPAGTRANS
jgi:hypothetical protein